MKKTPISLKKNDETTNNGSNDVQTTPSIKRVATKRQLVNETTEIQNSDSKKSKLLLRHNLETRNVNNTILIQRFGSVQRWPARDKGFKT